MYTGSGDSITSAADKICPCADLLCPIDELSCMQLGRGFDAVSAAHVSTIFLDDYHQLLLRFNFKKSFKHLSAHQ